MQSGPAPKIAMRSAERRAHPRKVRPRLANVAVASCRRDHLKSSAPCRRSAAPRLGAAAEERSNRGAHAPRERKGAVQRGVAGAHAYPAAEVALFDIVKRECGELRRCAQLLPGSCISKSGADAWADGCALRAFRGDGPDPGACFFLLLFTGAGRNHLITQPGRSSRWSGVIPGRHGRAGHRPRDSSG